MINQYEQGLPAQTSNVNQYSEQIQNVKFYKSAIFGFSSAAGRFQRDCQSMTSAGWKLQNSSYLGMDFWLRRIIVATYGK